jgi:hypothetical protein
MHHAEFLELGEPGIFWNNSLRNNVSLLRFLWSGRSIALRDKEVVRAVWLMRFVFVLSVIFLFCVLTLFVMNLATGG